jgi:hypothetical protein
MSITGMPAGGIDVTNISPPKLNQFFDASVAADNTNVDMGDKTV